MWQRTLQLPFTAPKRYASFVLSILVVLVFVACTFSPLATLSDEHLLILIISVIMKVLQIHQPQCQQRVKCCMSLTTKATDLLSSLTNFA